MRDLLRSSLSSFLYHGSRLLGQRSAGTRILCYHRVHPTDRGYLCVTPARFREQIACLASEGCEVVALRDVLADREHGPEDPGSRTVALTFDDGYLDNYEFAYGILREFGFTATVFCVTDRLGLPGYLAAAHLREMQRAGFSFGSHTVTHPHLTLLSREEKWREIADAKKKLEELLGLPCEFFCFPYGEYDEETVSLVREAGYWGACTNAPGVNRAPANAYLLRRTEIAETDDEENFKKKLAGAYDLLHRGLHWVRGRP